MKTVISADPPVNQAPPEVDPARDLPRGFYDFLLPLHRAFSQRQQELAARRRGVLEAAHQGRLPDYLPASEATTGSWKVSLPGWCQDQRNQMTGPADDAELVVKMLNSGAPGVMLDLEDSTVNEWELQRLGVENILQALRGTLTYHDTKRDSKVAIKPGKTVIWIRARGLHLHQGGVVDGELCSASLFDVARIVFAVDPSELKHPLAFYIPKSESAEEALFWRDMFQSLAEARGWPKNYIKCMALVESHPLAYQMEEFLYNLREHILGLNLGRWDYMASLIHFNLDDARWLLPDRNTIPHDVPFFQNLREVLPEICHKRGALAIGGMTALYPSRQDPVLHARRAAANRYPDLRPVPSGVGKRTVEGTRAAIRTVIRYRNGVLNGKGASLLDGYMEDLATDRIYRLMLAQRMRHAGVEDESGKPVPHTADFIHRMFDEELDKVVSDSRYADEGTSESFSQARQIAEAMVMRDEFNPI